MSEFVKCKIGINENGELVLNELSEDLKKELIKWIGRKKNVFTLVFEKGIVISKEKYDVVDARDMDEDELGEEYKTKGSSSYHEMYR